MSLWVPPAVSRELRSETERENALLLDRARQRAVIDDFNVDLKRMDPRLEMVWFDADVDLTGVVPGRYHLLRTEAGVPTTVIPICGPDGGYIEPNSGLFEWLRRQDMWNEGANRDRLRAKEEAQKALDRRKQRETEDRHEELKDRYNAAFRTSISMTDAAPWSQNQQGSRGKGRPHANVR